MIALALLACVSAAPTAPPPEPVPAPAPEHAPEKKVVNGAVFDAKLRGICDGSAIVKAPWNGWLVAYDEDTSLHAYDWQGRPLVERDLLPDLKIEGEYDLEAAAAVGDAVWWVGSHGLNGDDQPAPGRRMLFATNLPATATLDDLTVGRPIDLVPILRANPELAAILTDEAMKRGSKAGGLNIEAMAPHPDGGLVVGFRGPLSGKRGVDGDAVLVHLQPQGETFTAAAVHHVDLGGRGFRDLAVHEDRWLAVAGPVGKGADFALYWIDADFETRRVDEPEWLADLRPEGIVRHDEGWLLVSDDGKLDRADSTAKDGWRGCDKIRKKHGPGHEMVYARARTIPMPD